MGLMASVMRKNLISAVRGEYLDFVISRVLFALFTVGSSAILFRLFRGGLAPTFARYAGVESYLGFVIIGTAMYSFTHSIFLNVGRTLMTERREGTLEAVLLAPFSRLRYYAGSLLAQLLLVMVDLAALLALGRLLGVTFSFHLIPFGLGLVLLFLTLLGIAVLVSLVMLYLRDTFFVQNTALPLLLLLGGYIFPIAYLPAPLEALARGLPLGLAVDLVPWRAP
ncbi:MAG: ABC transporter permease [Bacillota bacterium]